MKAVSQVIANFTTIIDTVTIKSESPLRIIALGGNGFIGSHFIRHALNAGHDVTVVDVIDTPRHSHGLPYRYVRGTVTDLAQLPHLLATADILYHFAYSTVPATANADPARDLTENLAPLIGLLDVMRAVQLRRIVYLSSSSVYGPANVVPILENSVLKPISAYAVTKAAAEHYLGMYAVNWGLRPTILRPANPYGVDQGKVGLLGAVTTFLNFLASGQPVRIWGDGSVIRDFVYIDDLSRLLLAAGERDLPGTYNCGGGGGASLNRVIETIEKVTERSLPIIYEPARSFDPPSIILDIRNARDLLGWSPEISLIEGIRLLAASLGLPTPG